MTHFAERRASDGPSRRVHFTDQGEGDPLVLLPGLGGGARIFGTLPRRFARSGFRCLAIDPVGMPPSSDLPATGFVFEEAARDVTAVLSAAGLDQATLVGTSLGGKVALTTAALEPERVTHLVMLASSAVSTARSRRVYRFFEIAASSLSPADFAETVAPFLFGRTFHRERAGVVADIVRATRPDDASRALMVAQAQALRAFDGTAHAARVRAPTLCVAGLEDTLTGPDEVAQTAALIADAEHLEIPDAGHTLLLESASVFDAVCAFATQ